jgi:PAS domain S-box-containing protein
VLRKPSYKELESKVKSLEQEIARRTREKKALQKWLENLRSGKPLPSYIPPELDELEKVINVPLIQRLLEHFYRLTAHPVGIVDLQGKVLVETGWQDICTRFHHIHPQTLANCIETFRFRTWNVKEGEYLEYKCKNNLQVIATPIIIAGRHMGNLFLGQFFYENETQDIALFERQADRYGFDKEAYLDALKRVPLWSRDKVRREMEFYVSLVSMITQLSYSNLQLTFEITDRKQAEENLRTREATLNSILTAAQIGIGSSEGDVNRRIFRWVSDNLLKMLGYSTEELVGKETRILYENEEEFKRVGEFVIRELKERGLGETETRWIRKDGSVFDVLVNCALLALEDISAGWCFTAMDITERKRAEEAIKKALSQEKEAREKVEVIFKAVAEGLIFTDRNNRIQLMSPSAEKMFGTSMKDCFLQSVNAFLDQPALTGQLNDVLSQESNDSLLDLNLFNPQKGENRIIQAHSSAVRDVNGEVNGVITLFRDISREREMEQMKSEFICTAAHELRTPLTAVKGFSEILLKQKDLNADEKAEFLSIIHEKSMALEKIIDDLLDISRIEAGDQISLTKTCSDISLLLGETTSRYQREYPGHRFKIILPEQPLELLMDREKMVRVLDNLVSNAVKFSEPESLIKLVCEVSDGEVIIAVEDDGVGMTSTQAERVFDKFYRVDSSDTGKEGLGLGMHIVKNTVEAHNGRTWVETEPGKGTKVFLTLPLAPSYPEPADGK